jgi:hypothetical protein
MQFAVPTAPHTRDNELLCLESETLRGQLDAADDHNKNVPFTHRDRERERERESQKQVKSRDKPGRHFGSRTAQRRIVDVPSVESGAGAVSTSSLSCLHLEYLDFSEHLAHLSIFHLPHAR